MELKEFLAPAGVRRRSWSWRRRSGRRSPPGARASPWRPWTAPGCLTRLTTRLSTTGELSTTLRKFSVLPSTTASSTRMALVDAMDVWTGKELANSSRTNPTTSCMKTSLLETTTAWGQQWRSWRLSTLTQTSRPTLPSCRHHWKIPATNWCEWWLIINICFHGR